MKTLGVEFLRSQLGWICEVYFAVTTAKQFTDERHCVREGSSWWLLAYWKARREAKRQYRSLVVAPGQREAKGWAETNRKFQPTERRNLTKLCLVFAALPGLFGLTLLAHGEDKKEVKFVETVGVLQAPKEKGQNYILEVKVFVQQSDEGGVEETQYLILAFDDMHKDWPELKKALPDMVGKRVVATHREGYVEFGKSKVLLATTAKLVEVKK